MSYFKHHIFFCTNKRPNGEACCADQNASELQEYAKKKCKEHNLNGEGKVRVNKAGCLDRCEHGPVCVVYPEGVWYQMVDHEDVDEIVNEHLIHGRIVERLQVK